MCFSATASFVASAGLTGIGAASWVKADKRHKILATIPFLFAVQQAIEGVQWLLPHPGDLCVSVGYSYLFFAYLFWPIYIPLTLSIIDTQRTKLMRGFMYLGIIVSLYILSQLLFAPLDVQIYNHSIRYLVDIPLQYTGTAIYVFVVCGSILSSSKSSIRWLGAAIFASALVSAYFFYTTFTSVWCFFGAILSSLVYWYIRQQSKDENHRRRSLSV